MTEIDLKSAARATITTEWERFSAEHPKLARFLDRPLVIEHASELLTSDPAYRRAMEAATVAGVAAETLRALARFTLERLLKGFGT